MPAWPEELPCAPIAGTLQIGLEPNIAEFKPDVGRPQRSKRYTLSRRPYGFRLSLTAAQRVILDDFFDEECSSGVKSFTMRDVGDFTNAPAIKTFSWVSPPEFNQIGPAHFEAQISIARED